MILRGLHVHRIAAPKFLAPETYPYTQIQLCPSDTTAPSNCAEDDFRSFVMTFNKAQRQTVKSAGIYPPSPYPTHPFIWLIGTIPVLFIWQHRSCSYWKANTMHRKQKTNNIKQLGTSLLFVLLPAHTKNELELPILKEVDRFSTHTDSRTPR
jgi:hypothetical protein